MRKTKIVLAVLLVAAFFIFAAGSGESSTTDQGSGTANTETKGNDSIGKYSVVIDSCRLASDYAGKPVVIVKYQFTNVSDDNPTAFYIAFDDNVYQNGVGLNGAYVLDDNANYSADNQTKAIKKGASIDVEVAYELNDTTSEIEVEVEELFSFSDNKLIKKFSIAN
ncbi:MAG: DUF5067 domain-containing protein [Peptococcaceae bacterium]|nr:DUF5067 domain-containing protein [Oscillospiraceae bacterium]MBQ7026433.1 DUF5067 domain-containing protein [Peptococcaceae bacterium]